MRVGTGKKGVGFTAGLTAIELIATGKDDFTGLPITPGTPTDSVLQSSAFGCGCGLFVDCSGSEW